MTERVKYLPVLLFVIILLISCKNNTVSITPSPVKQIKLVRINIPSPFPSFNTVILNLKKERLLRRSVLLKNDVPKDLRSINAVLKKFKDSSPLQWGMEVKGVKTSFDTKDKVIALTFDACDNPYYSESYDKELIAFLKKEQIPATLFLSGQWIIEYPLIAKELAKNSLFEIENHGFYHRPLSVTGQYAYGISGTYSVEEVVDEIELNKEEIKRITGLNTRFFRSGTAHYDEVAVEIAENLGYKIVNFTINGDGGATFGVREIAETLKESKPGSIVIYHMNHPYGSTFEGVKEGIFELKKKGFKFVKLSEYNLKGADDNEI